jgi:hypothetical protein
LKIIRLSTKAFPSLKGFSRFRLGISPERAPACMTFLTRDDSNLLKTSIFTAYFFGSKLVNPYESIECSLCEDRRLS